MDPITLTCFLFGYMLFVAAVCVFAYKKWKRYNLRKNKPKLVLINGGKKERNNG